MPDPQPTVPGWGSNLLPGPAETPPVPWHHSGDSYVYFLSTQKCLFSTCHTALGPGDMAMNKQQSLGSHRAYSVERACGGKGAETLSEPSIHPPGTRQAIPGSVTSLSTCCAQHHAGWHSAFSAGPGLSAASARQEAPLDGHMHAHTCPAPHGPTGKGAKCRGHSWAGPWRILAAMSILSPGHFQ